MIGRWEGVGEMGKGVVGREGVIEHRGYRTVLYTLINDT